jgi:hypothetical protein
MARWPEASHWRYSLLWHDESAQDSAPTYWALREPDTASSRVPMSKAAAAQASRKVVFKAEDVFIMHFLDVGVTTDYRAQISRA